MMKSIVYGMLLLLATQVSAQEELSARVGYARDIDSDVLLYTESHLETYENGMIVSDRVTYKDAEGKVIAEKEVDYQRDAIMPDFDLENFVTGHREKVSKLETELEVVFAPNEKTAEKRKLIELPDNGIIDAGFDQFIVQHWDDITSGNRLVRKMLIPSMRKFIDFRIYQDSVDSELGRRILKVEPDSALFRFLADPLVLEYDLEKPRLYLFTGTSNMRGNDGKNLQVNISFPAEEYRISRK